MKQNYNRNDIKKTFLCFICAYKICAYPCDIELKKPLVKGA